MPVKTTNAIISCLCGSVKQIVTLFPVDTDIVFCHCTSCRHLTGQLFTSYVALDSAPTSLDGLTTYHSDPDHPGLETTTYYFCSTCGCHVFQRSTYYSDSDDSNNDDDENNNSNEKPEWAIATGVITCSTPHNPDYKVRWQHQKVEDTKDWGLSLWLPTAFASISDNNSNNNNNKNQKFTTKNLLSALSVPPPPSTTTTTSSTNGGHDGNDQLLRANCHCKRISFSLSWPSLASTLPHRGYPDTMYSYAEEPSSVTSNPNDEKWWLRGLCYNDKPKQQQQQQQQEQGTSTSTSIFKATKYFTGACVCKSCRLASGFEIQCWAFVPRCNIHFDGCVNQGGGLDFATLFPRDLLKTYESSPGVWREFCPTCGATVFYHGMGARDVIDVSVGLFDDGDGGARAEDWLEWGRERVSFAEEIREGRSGGMADWAERLLRGLEGGLRG